METTECTECDGTGQVETIGWGCRMPVSDCCGGCVTGSHDCNECEGTGIIEE